jgi:hypothetical protein
MAGPSSHSIIGQKIEEKNIFILNSIPHMFRHFGGSEGEPRNLIDISKILEDWTAAISYVISSGLGGSFFVLK